MEPVEDRSKERAEKSDIVWHVLLGELVYLVQYLWTSEEHAGGALAVIVRQKARRECQSTRIAEKAVCDWRQACCTCGLALSMERKP
ncbi:MAG: hypothetical protein ACOX6T_20870 [Myxococcales bacterium]|jgi:hypothetical protein